MIEKSETFFISGSVQRDDGREIMAAEVDAFMDKFFALLDAEGYGFGGAYGLEPVQNEA